MAVWARIDGRVQVGCCLGVLFGVTARAHFCEIDGRVLLGMQFGVLVQVLFWDAVWVSVRGVWAQYWRDSRLCALEVVCCALRGVLLEVLVRKHPPVFRCLGSVLVYFFY